MPSVLAARDGFGRLPQVLSNAEVQQADPTCRDIGLIGRQREDGRKVHCLRTGPRKRRHVKASQALDKGVPLARREQHEALADVRCGVPSAGLAPIDDPREDSGVGEDVVSFEIEVGPRECRAGSGRSVIKDPLRAFDVEPPCGALGAARKRVEPILKA